MKEHSVVSAGRSETVLLDPDVLVPGSEPLRTIGADEGIDELAASIAKMGVLQPLLVRERGERNPSIHYEIIAGHRRHRAALMAGLSQVPCIICDLDSKQAFLHALAENLQRNNLHPLDEAWAYDRLIEEGIARNRADIARHLGVSRARITQRMKLLELDKTTKTKLIEFAESLSEYHARLLLRVSNLDARHHLADLAGQKALSGRELRAMIENLDEQTALEAWQARGDSAMSPRKYEISFTGLRIFVDYDRVNKRQALDAIKKVVTCLEANHPSGKHTPKHAVCNSRESCA